MSQPNSIDTDSAPRLLKILHHHSSTESLKSGCNGCCNNCPRASDDEPGNDLDPTNKQGQCHDAQ